MTWPIVQEWSRYSIILNYKDRSDSVRFMMKIRQDNNMIDHTSAVYVKIKTKLSWTIKQDAVYHEKTHKTTTWSIVQVWSL